jgi:hypothetical protein
MPTGLHLFNTSISTTANVYSPIGASGDPLSNAIGALPGAAKSLPGTIAGKLKGLWQNLRGTPSPARSVVDAGPGDYRLQRKGQAGYQRLNVLGKTPAQPRATYADPQTARVRVAPSQAAAAGAAPAAVASGNGGTPAAPATLASVTARILAPAVSAPAVGASTAGTFDRLVAGSAERRGREAAVLADIDQLVRLADAAGADLRPAPGAPRSDAAKAFDVLVGKLLTLNAGTPGKVLRRLADTDASPAGLRDAAYRHAAGSAVSAAATPGVRVKLDVAVGLLGNASRYDPPARDLQALGAGDRAVLKASRLAEAERDTADALAESAKSIGDSILSLHRSGVLDADTLKPLRDFQPLAAMSQSPRGADHVGALPVLAELLASVAKGNAAIVNLLTAGDSRHDATALKLKTIGLPEGSPARDKVVLQHTLSRAKFQLAQAWTQQEKVSRIAGSGERLGGMGRLGTRVGQVINQGGSDQLRVNSQLLRVLREGPSKAVAAREAAARQGAGIQADARAGKDVNLLIAQVMLLQRRADALEGGNPVQTARDTLARQVSALPAGLQAKLGDGLSAMALPADERPGVIALGLAKPETFAVLTRAAAAERDHADASRARERLLGGNDETRAQAAIDLTGEHGVHVDLAQEMAAVPDTAPSSAPLTREARLDAVVDARASAATSARDTLAVALGVDELSADDMRALRDTLQAIHTLNVAERTARQAGEDGTLGLSTQDFVDMGFSAQETEEVQRELSKQLGTPIEALFSQGLTSTADARKVTDAVNNGIDRLFVNGTSSLTQGTMRDVSRAFPEAAARGFLTATLEAAQRAHGVVGAATPDAVFGGIFGDSLSSPTTPLSRLLQQTGAQVTEAQTRMTSLVGEFAALDDGAAVARQVLASVATPTRKFDPTSDSAKANATRLVAAADTLDTLDAADAVLAASTTALNTHVAEAARDRTVLLGEIAGASRALTDSREAIATMETRLATIATELAAPDVADAGALTAEQADITARLTPARASQTRQHQTVQDLQTRLADLDDANAATTARLTAEVAADRNTRGAIQSRLDAQIQTVRWMSPTTLERSIRPQDRITTTAELRAFLGNADTRSAMTALHTLHALPAAKEGKLREITEQAAQADLALEAHRAALRPAPGVGVDPAQLQSAIRFAVLDTALAWPDGPGKFDPLEHRDAIETRLRQWGLDSTVIRPEIDAVLHQQFDLAQVDDWTKDAQQAFGAPVQAAPGAARRAVDAARTFVTDNSPLDTGTRRALTDSVRSMRVGDSLGLSRGLSWGLDTTATPVEATGTLTAQVVVDIRSKNALEVRRTDEGVEIVFKAGMDGAGALGIGATLFGAAKVTATARGGHESLAGAGFRFADPASAAKFLDTVLDGKKISPRTWALASETALVSDRATLLGAQVDAKATAKNLLAKVPGSEVVTKYLMVDGNVAGSGFEFLGGVQAKVGASREWRSEQRQNASGHVVEKSRSTTIEGSISVGIWASLPTVQDSVIDHFVDDNPLYTAIDDAVNRNQMMRGAPQGAFGGKAQDYGAPDNHVFDPFSPASVKQLSINLTTKRTLTEASSVAFERDGLLSARGNTITRSIVVTGVAGDRDLAMVRPGFSSASVQAGGGDSLYSAVTDMRKGVESAKMLTDLLAAATPGSTLSVTYALKDDARLVINDMIKTAEHAEKAGDLDRARTLGELAKSMYEDEHNYAVDTLQVSKKSTVDNSNTLASVGIMSIGRVSEGNAERPTMILAVAGGATARAMTPDPVAPPPESPAPDSAIASGSPGVLVDVEAQAELLAAQAAMPVAPAALAPPDQRLVTRFEGAVLPAVEPVRAERFHLERQHDSACAVHSLNAFVGGPGFEIESFTAWARDTTAAHVPADQRDALRPETASTGFSAHWVERALTLAADTPAAHGRDWQIGSTRASAGPSSAGLASVTLPDLAATDRLVVEVEVHSAARRAIDAHALAHFVAFRKDDQGAWWLLDSRSTEVDAPPAAELASTGGPIRRQVDPQAWLNGIARHADLKSATVIGPGITRGDMVATLR